MAPFYSRPATMRGVGVSSLAMGFLGLVFFWWTPFGIVLALAGLILGLAGWTLAAHHGLTERLSMGGTLLSLIALAIDLFVAINGSELITFMRP